MRGAYGKPQGTVARVNIGQPLMSIRCKDAHEATAVEGQWKFCIFFRTLFSYNLRIIQKSMHVMLNNIFF